MAQTWYWGSFRDTKNLLLHQVILIARSVDSISAENCDQFFPFGTVTPFIPNPDGIIPRPIFVASASVQQLPTVFPSELFQRRHFPIGGSHSRCFTLVNPLTEILVFEDDRTVTAFGAFGQCVPLERIATITGCSIPLDVLNCDKV